jgi:hypothetical protein
MWNPSGAFGPTWLALPALYSAMAALVCGLGISLVTPAAATQQIRHSPQPRSVARYAAPTGDIVVHTGRNLAYTQNPSYNQDPWQSFLAGPHYYADTALTGPGQIYSFGQTTVLPSRFDPPGQSEPLFRF